MQFLIYCSHAAALWGGTQHEFVPLKYEQPVLAALTIAEKKQQQSFKTGKTEITVPHLLSQAYVHLSCSVSILCTLSPLPQFFCCVSTPVK